LLRSIARDHPALAVAVLGNERTFTSALLESAGDGASLLIDELSPDPPGLRRGGRLRVFADSGNVPLSFGTTVLRNEERDGLSCYRIKAPLWVNLRVRRADPRFLAPHGIRTYLLDTGARIYEGLLANISLGGICVALDRQAGDTLRRGMRLPSCTVPIGPESALQSALEVRYVQPLAGRQSICLGGRFLRMTGRQRKRLMEFLCALQLGQGSPE